MKRSISMYDVCLENLPAFFYGKWEYCGNEDKDEYCLVIGYKPRENGSVFMTAEDACEEAKIFISFCDRI